MGGGHDPFFFKKGLFAEHRINGEFSTRGVGGGHLAPMVAAHERGEGVLGCNNQVMASAHKNRTDSQQFV